MTGIFVQIYREGRAQSVEIEDLTATEWTSFVQARPVAEGWTWARALAMWVHETVPQEP